MYLNITGKALLIVSSVVEVYKLYLIIELFSTFLTQSVIIICTRLCL